MEEQCGEQSIQKRSFTFDHYMMLVAIAGNFLFYCQSFTIFFYRSAQDVSFLGFLVQFFTLGSWLLYGIKLKSKVLIISNVLGVIGVFLVLLGIILYR